jgi:ABC-type glycerol-3-phosphate transport system permease component
MLGDDDGRTLHRSYHRILITFLALLSTPIVLMYVWLLLASVNRESLTSFLPTG